MSIGVSLQIIGITLVLGVCVFVYLILVWKQNRIARKQYLRQEGVSPDDLKSIETLKAARHTFFKICLRIFIPFLIVLILLLLQMRIGK